MERFGGAQLNLGNWDEPGDWRTGPPFIFSLLQVISQA